MNGSPWMNWQQFAELNETETQRAADERRQQQEQERLKMQGLAGKLVSEAQAAGKSGGYRGIEGLGSYTELMEAQKKAQAAQMNAPAGAAWEGYLQKPGESTYKSPWADLEKHLGVARQAGQQGQTYYKTMRANQERDLADAKQREANRLAEAQRRSEANKAAGKQAVEQKRVQNIAALKNPWTLMQAMFSPGGLMAYGQGKTSVQ